MLGSGPAWAKPDANDATSCPLKPGGIEHVIFLIFDNVHFLRDNQTVPSDLEQMPNLLNFIRDNGTLLTNNHTVLISHTANGILTNLTGMYSDRHGQSVANSYRFFKADEVDWLVIVVQVLDRFGRRWYAATNPPTPSADTNFNMVTRDSGTPKTLRRRGSRIRVRAATSALLRGRISCSRTTTRSSSRQARRRWRSKRPPARPISRVRGSVGGFAVGQTITLDLAPNAEQRTIATVGTSGAGGTRHYAHCSTDQRPRERQHGLRADRDRSGRRHDQRLR